MKNGVMTSHMINNIYHILFDGHIVLCGGVGNVSSPPRIQAEGRHPCDFCREVCGYEKARLRLFRTLSLLA